MNETASEALAAILAAAAAGGGVWALFAPALSGSSVAARRLATLAAMRKTDNEDSAETRGSIVRVHEAALKAVAESKRVRRASRLNGRIEAAGLSLSQTGFSTVCAGLGAGAFLTTVISGAPVLLALATATFAGWILPLRTLSFLAARRRDKFLAVFTPAVDMILRGTKSGLAVVDCLNIVATDADALIRREFAAIAAQLRAGVPLPEAMARLGTVMPVPEVRFFVLIMSMQSQTGGNLSEALGNLAGVLRDRQRLAAKVRVASAEAKASAIAIGMLPFAVVAASMVMAPDYIRLLWTTDAGRRVFLYSAMWLVVGIVVLRRMARIEL